MSNLGAKRGSRNAWCRDAKGFRGSGLRVHGFGRFGFRGLEGLGFREFRVQRVYGLGV